MSELFSVVDVAALANGLGAPTPILVEVLPPHHFAGQAGLPFEVSR